MKGWRRTSNRQIVKMLKRGITIESLDIYGHISYDKDTMYIWAVFDTFKNDNDFILWWKHLGDICKKLKIKSFTNHLETTEVNNDIIKFYNKDEYIIKFLDVDDKREIKGRLSIISDLFFDKLKMETKIFIHSLRKED